MNGADMELAKMVYLASGLAVVLFTSMILRGLWRPLRFVLITCAISFMFTPYFVPQKMPDGSEHNMVPAYIVMMNKLADDHEHWREIILETGKPIAVVAGTSSFLALVLAFLLPKPRKKIPTTAKKSSRSTKTSEEEIPTASTEKTATHTNKKHKKKIKYKKKKKHNNPYLPDDFDPSSQKAQP